MNSLLSIGNIRKLHGTNGEVQCQLDNDLFFDADPDFVFISLDAIQVPFRVLDWRSKGDDVLLQLKGVDSERAANRLVGANVAIEYAADANDGETLTWQDLTGLRVVDDEQGDLGCVEHVDESTANTLLFLDNGRVMPIHEDFIIDINATTLKTHYTFLIP